MCPVYDYSWSLVLLLFITLIFELKPDGNTVAVAVFIGFSIVLGA